MAATMDYENGYTANDLGSPPESDEIGKHHFPFNNFDSDDDDDDDDHSYRPVSVGNQVSSGNSSTAYYSPASDPTTNSNNQRGSPYFYNDAQFYSRTYFADLRTLEAHTVNSCFQAFLGQPADSLAVNSTLSPSPQYFVLIDSGCQLSMTPVRNQLTNLQACHIRIHTAKNDPSADMVASEFGDFQFRVRDKFGIFHDRTLHNVLFVPQAPVFLIGTGHLNMYMNGVFINAPFTCVCIWINVMSYRSVSSMVWYYWIFTQFRVISRWYHILLRPQAVMR